MRAFSVSVALGGLFLLSCQQDVAPMGPGDVVLKWVEQMRQVHGEERAGDAVLQLLWKPARDNLKERARRASALSGREMSSSEMLAPSWFSLQIQPKRTEVRLDGSWAEVTVIGADEEKVHTRCIQEDGEWKVVLELPPLAPIRRRVDPPNEKLAL